MNISLCQCMYAFVSKCIEMFIDTAFWMNIFGSAHCVSSNINPPVGLFKGFFMCCPILMPTPHIFYVLHNTNWRTTLNTFRRDWTEVGFLSEQKLVVILHIYISYCIEITVSLWQFYFYRVFFFSFFTELPLDNHF